MTNHGEFTLNSEYNSYIQENTEEPNTKWIWKTLCNNHEKYFLWKCFHKALPTMASLHHLNITSYSTCPICYSSDETIEHALRDCTKNRMVWSIFGMPANSYSENFKTWLHTNSTKVQVSRLNIPWSTIYFYTVHSICLNKNNLLFQNEVKQLAEIAALNKAAEFWSNEITNLCSSPPPQSTNTKLL